MTEEKTGNQTPKKSTDKSPPPAPTATGGSGAGIWAWIKKIFTGFAYGIGFGKDKIEDPGHGAADVSTRLAYERTDLAVERNYLAAERTLMAWIRTSLSMISFGFTIGKIAQVLDTIEIKGALGRVRTVSAQELAHFLVTLGTFALIGASLQHWKRMRQFHAMGLPRKLSITFIVAILLALVGFFALSALVLEL